MSNYDLSILIPARNEMFLAQTVKNILENKRGKTEILVGLDGQWSDPEIEDHPDVTIFYSPVSLGQRGMTNQLARLSKAKYVMKLDAHCALDEGFDVKMMEAMRDDYTMIPAMYNLHAFDWVCSCGSRQYQGPSQKYKKCPDCGKERTREILWKPRWSRRTMYWRFDKDLHFQYWGDYERRPESIGDVVEIFSAQGSCFMLTRKKYWELDICDEGHGSWGQQGVEVACKTWLSGGKLMVNKKTWYAHMFRTQGGDFGFPYPISGKEQDHARDYSRDMWLNDKWDKAIHPLSWLLEKFKPPEFYDQKEVEKERGIVGKDQANPMYTVTKDGAVTKGIIFYTDNQLNLKIAKKVQKQLSSIADAKGLSITSSSLKPMSFGDNVALTDRTRGYLTMAMQILAALEKSTAEIVYFCEHDVLYHPSHFDFVPQEKDRYYYNTNVWRVRASDGFALKVDDLRQLSGLVVYRETALKHFRKRLELLQEKMEMIRKEEEDEFWGLSETQCVNIEQKFSSYVRAMGFEPGTHGRPEKVDDLGCDDYIAQFPNIDIRHESNLTASRWVKEAFRNKKYTKGWTESSLENIPGWNQAKDVLHIDSL